jgi:transposase InsO family protein
MEVRAAIVNWPEGAPRGAVSRFCAAAGISRSQFYEIRRRARVEGPLAAMSPQPRSYPDPHPQATPVAVEELAVTIRKELAGQGLDHGPVTVRWHLQQLGLTAPATSTLARIFTRRGMVVPAPQKRPRSSYRRFEFAMVHECWQIDAFEWPLVTDPVTGSAVTGSAATGSAAVCVIYQVLDDRSRFMLATYVGEPGVGENKTDAIAVVDQALAVAGQAPCLFLSDNGVAFNQTRVGRTSKLVTHLKNLGTRSITGRPSHPQTQGKDERAHQTLQRWLAAHPARTRAELQQVVEDFDQIYNHHRPHQSLGMKTPAQALSAGPVAIPPRPPEQTTPAGNHDQQDQVRVRQRKVARNGNLVVRRDLIQMGLEAAGTTVTVITSGATVNVFNSDGQHLRTVVLVPGQRYYGNGKKSPGGPKHQKPSTLT